MAVTNAPPPSGGGGAWQPAGAAAGPAENSPGAMMSPPGRAREVAGTTLWVLALCLIGFALGFVVFSRLFYDRAQSDSYANFRTTLEEAVAPVGPTQPFNPGLLLVPGTPVALLTIPEIGLNAVVSEGTSGQVLENGPGHLRDTPLPGQPGISEIFGRRVTYGGPFGGITKLRLGDTFTTTTGQGVSHFRVIGLLHAGDSFSQTAGLGYLFLVTADGPALAPSGVVRVYAELTSKVYPAPAMVVTSADIASSEVPLGTDSGALVPLVLWGAALVLAASTLSWFRQRWGRWQVWIVAVPVMGFLFLSVADQAAVLLPNLM
jgi:sortase A